MQSFSNLGVKNAVEVVGYITNNNKVKGLIEQQVFAVLIEAKPSAKRLLACAVVWYWD